MASNRSPGFRGTKLERCSRLCGFREEYFLRFSYISLCKADKPWDGAIYRPGLLFEQTLERTIRRCYIPNMEGLGLVVSERKSPGFYHFMPRGHNLIKTW